MKNTLTLSLMICASLAQSNIVYGGDCGVAQARDNLAVHSQEATSLIQQKLKKAVIDCFNPSFPSYITKVNNLLDSANVNLGDAPQNILNSYDYYLAKVKIARAKAIAAARANPGGRYDFDALAQQDAEVIAAANAFTAKIQPAKENVNKILAEITRYNKDLSTDGFTTSPKTVGNEYKYKNCSPTNNDAPGESWVNFKKAAFSIPDDMDKLKAGVECQKTAVGALESVNSGNGAGMNSIRR